VTNIELKPEWVQEAEEKYRKDLKGRHGFLDELRRKGKTPEQIDPYRRAWDEGIQHDFPGFVEKVCEKLSRRGLDYPLRKVVRFLLSRWPLFRTLEFGVSEFQKPVAKTRGDRPKPKRP
jgi:hypothetical protein